MFELLADGTVERLCSKFHEKGIIYGFGGIASIGRGLLPAENIIIEHYRLGSSMTILSRSFCDVNKFQNTADLYQIFNEGVTKIRKFEKEVLEGMYSFKDNYHEILNKIRGNKQVIKMNLLITGAFSGDEEFYQKIKKLGYTLFFLQDEKIMPELAGN